MNREELRKQLTARYPTAGASDIDHWVEDRMMTSTDKIVERETIKFDAIISMIKERGYKAHTQEIDELEQAFNAVIKAHRLGVIKPLEPVKQEPLGKVETYECRRAKRMYENEENEGRL